MDAEGLNATEEAELEPDSTGAERAEVDTGAEPIGSPDDGELSDVSAAAAAPEEDAAGEEVLELSPDDSAMPAEEDSADTAEGENPPDEKSAEQSEQAAYADQRVDAADQKLAGLAEDLKPAINRSRIERFMIGFLFALSFYLIEAGLAEVLLARNAACIESLTQYRLAPNPFEVCMSELGLFATHSVSRGFFGPDAPGIIAWPVMGMLYALAGGGLAQLSLRRAIAAFLVLQTIVVAIFTAVGYLSQFIV